MNRSLATTIGLAILAATGCATEGPPTVRYGHEECAHCRMIVNDERYAAAGLPPIGAIGPPPVFAGCEVLFPETGRALEIACGRGRSAVWLASRGMTVTGLDVSPVAVSLAEELAALEGVTHRCSFEVVDLDLGLPPGAPVDLLFCHLYWNPRLVPSMLQRLAAGGLLAMAVLSEVDAGPGPHRVAPGTLPATFADLAVLEHGEVDGKAWIVARRPD